MSSLGLSNLRSISNWLGSNTGVDRGNKGLGVEGGSNGELGVENRETRVSNSESSSVSNVLNLLKLTIGINIRVSSGDSSIGVSNLSLGRVEVRVTIVQVAKLILGLELAAGNIGSSIWSSIGSCSNGGSSGVWQTSIGILCTSAADNGRNCNKSSHDCTVVSCVMLNDVP